MANVTKNKTLLQKQMFSPYGNSWVDVFRLQTNSSGIMTDSDQTTALIQTNVVRLGILPAGLQLHDSLTIVSDAFTASVTCKLGWAYVDGVDVTATPQDDDYFSASVALNTAGRYVANNTASAVIQLPKDAYLIATIAGADNASAGIADVIIKGVWLGLPSAVPA